MRFAGARVALVTLAAFTVLGPPAWASEPRAAEMCGTKSLYGKKLEIRVVGQLIPCSRVREIIRGRCRDGRRWSCFSFRPPSPVLVWFRERERFREDWSTTIEARRRPCAESEVTADAWSEARRSLGWDFPTKLQVLADDLMRCGLLEGMSYRAVLRLLGRPFSRSTVKGRRFLSYHIGPERDSFFQIDDELLSIEFDRKGRFESIDMYQG